MFALGVTLKNEKVYLKGVSDLNACEGLARVSQIGPWISRIIDAKGINVTQPIRLSGCLTEAQKRAKNTKKAVLGGTET